MEWLQKNKWYIIAVIAAIALFTNPGIETHKAKIKNEFLSMTNEVIEEMQTGLLSNGGGLLSGKDNPLPNLFMGSMVESFLSNSFTTQNYLFFSLGRLTREGNTSTISVGLLGNVFLLEDYAKMGKEANAVHRDIYSADSLEK